MCVAALAWQAHPDWLLVVAGNRDEFHARPSAPLARWEDGSGIIAGRDLLGGGTWLGIAESAEPAANRMVLVTNYRVPEGSVPGRPSRGKLVTDLLRGHEPEPVETMNPFNLVEIAGTGARFLTNHPRAVSQPLAPGIHGLSNGGFEMPWPKTRQVEASVQAWLNAPGSDVAPLLDALRAETPAPAPTALQGAPEPRFAPVFIRDAVYGTRCSTVITVHRDGTGAIVERSFAPDGSASGEVRIDFLWPQA
ncbi:NRDE family protein [Novosphingobium sp. ZW T3_23]|uniref:NRDE family protein n=1 Tax=Novosphingobium sp. ZW T3_23 TaxID=3378084 RepID=UPI00385433BC